MTHITIDRSSGSFAASLSRLVGGLTGLLASWQQGLAAARRYNDLSILSRQELADVGLVQGDLAREAMFPTRDIPGVR